MKTLLSNKVLLSICVGVGQPGSWRSAAKCLSVVAVCAVLTLTQAGCGPLETRLFDDPDDHTYLQQSERAPWGTIGVVTGGFVPEADFPRPATFPGLSPGGAAVGAVGGAALWSTVILASGCLNPFAAATCPAAIPFALGGAAVGGVAAGAVGQAKTAPLTAEQIQEAVNEALEKLYLQDHVGDRALKYTEEITRQTVVMAPPVGPTTSQQQPDYSTLQDIGIDTVLEIRVLKAGMSPAWPLERRYMLYMTARARLIRVSDATTLHDRHYAFLSVPHTPEEWADNSAEAFRRSMSAGFQELAEQIVERLFLVYAPPGYREPSWWVIGDFAPLQPVIPAKGVQGGSCYGNIAWHISEVDSLQPTLQWQAFPTTDMVQADQDRELNGIADVRYDLRLYHAGDLVYQITTENPQHAVEQPLKKCSGYLMTYRARFNLNGLPRATHWAGYHGPVLHCMDLTEIWFVGSDFYTPFKTPCPGEKK